MSSPGNDLIGETARGLPQPAETGPLWGGRQALLHGTALIGMGSAGERSVPAGWQGEMRVYSRHRG